MMRNKKRISLILIGMLFLCLAATGKKRKIVKVKPFVEQDTIKINETFKLELKVIVTRYWHINTNEPNIKFLIPTKVKFEPENHVEVVSVSFPKGRKRRISYLKKSVRILEGTFNVTITMKLTKPLDAEIPIKGKFIYQACTTRSCLPPDTITFSVPVKFNTP